MNRFIRVGCVLQCTLVGLGIFPSRGFQGSTARAAVLLPGTNLDYTDPASWDIAGVPGDASHSADSATIASGGHGTRSAVYNSS
ncbi:MAG: hypothetical protein U1E05_24140, partial [Patescibacteria group bacterium]|nr:hypothetical protein [Patescibacteria group bacterium]